MYNSDIFHLHGVKIFLFFLRSCKHSRKYIQLFEEIYQQYDKPYLSFERFYADASSFSDCCNVTMILSLLFPKSRVNLQPKFSKMKCF